MWSLESGVNFYTVDQQYSQSLIYTNTDRALGWPERFVASVVDVQIHIYLSAPQKRAKQLTQSQKWRSSTGLYNEEDEKDEERASEETPSDGCSCCKLEISFSLRLRFYQPAGFLFGCVQLDLV